MGGFYFSENSWVDVLFILKWASHAAIVVKNPPTKAGDIRDVGLIPRLGRFPDEDHGNPLQFLAWRIPWTEEHGGLQPIVLQRVGHD